MGDELDDFTAQLNNVNEDDSKPQASSAIPGIPPGASPEQIAAIKAA